MIRRVLDFLLGRSEPKLDLKEKERRLYNLELRARVITGDRK